jgi:hypothetical protein
MFQDEILGMKSELRRMAKKDLLRMVFSQPEKNCILGGPCPFLLKYQEIRFCVSEILGQKCQMEKLRPIPEDEEENGEEHNGVNPEPDCWASAPPEIPW